MILNIRFCFRFWLTTGYEVNSSGSNTTTRLNASSTLWFNTSVQHVCTPGSQPSNSRQIRQAAADELLLSSSSISLPLSANVIDGGCKRGAESVSLNVVLATMLQLHFRFHCNKKSQVATTLTHPLLDIKHPKPARPAFHQLYYGFKPLTIQIDLQFNLNRF